MARRPFEWQAESDEIRRRHAGRLSRACRRMQGGQTCQRNRAGSCGAANPFSYVTHLHKASSELRQAPMICRDNGLVSLKFATKARANDGTVETRQTFRNLILADRTDRPNGRNCRIVRAFRSQICFSSLRRAASAPQPALCKRSLTSYLHRGRGHDQSNSAHCRAPNCRLWNSEKILRLIAI